MTVRLWKQNWKNKNENNSGKRIADVWFQCEILFQKNYLSICTINWADLYACSENRTKKVLFVQDDG